MFALIRTVLYLFQIAVIGRIILGYFPISEGSAVSSVYGVLYRITEPVLGPVRRVIPSVGMFDFSPIVVIIGLQIVQGALPR